MADSAGRTKSKKPLERPSVRKQVEGWIVEGLPNTEIARRLGLHHSAIAKFRKRHEAEVTALVAEVERQIIDYAIASKVNRIADLDNLRNMAILELRQSGYAWDEISKNGVKRKVSGAVSDLKDTLKQAAEELGQLPRPADQAINVNIGVAVALAWSDGSEA